MTASALKIGAVVSALALGSIYVSIQQRKGAAQAAKPSPAAPAAEKEIVLMPGSKSAGGGIEIPTPNPAPPADEPVVLMPSSKSIVMPLFSTRDTGDPPSDVPDIIMSSSKSGAVDIDTEEWKALLKQIQVEQAPDSKSERQQQE